MMDIASVRGGFFFYGTIYVTVTGFPFPLLEKNKVNIPII